jgi:heme/copper-type cytochrome/quinol oxidase subunit 3
MSQNPWKNFFLLSEDHQKKLNRPGLHTFVPLSWLPIMTTVLLILIVHIIVDMFFHGKTFSIFKYVIFFFIFFLFILSVSSWIRVHVMEVSGEGYTEDVRNSLIYGMILFILSEALFFTALFWTFFDASLSPSIFIGGVWPPVGIVVFSWKGIPLLNTLILLTSGIFVTMASYGFVLPNGIIAIPASRFGTTVYRNILLMISFKNFIGFLFRLNKFFFDKRVKDKNIVSANSLSTDFFDTEEMLYFFNAFWINNKLRLAFHANFVFVVTGLILAIGLGFFFTIFQIYEYCHAPFSAEDSIYGSVFYILTSFHGLHVVAGSIFLFYWLYRVLFLQLDNREPIGFVFASWYWHFVDVIWLFLFLFVYVWGS